jgi:hypothetical protein
MVDVGLVLEFAHLLGSSSEQGPDVGPCINAYHSKCMQHVARVALRRLGCFCELGWPATLAQVGSLRLVAPT